MRVSKSVSVRVGVSMSVSRSMSMRSSTSMSMSQSIIYEYIRSDLGGADTSSCSEGRDEGKCGYEHENGCAY